MTDDGIQLDDIPIDPDFAPDQREIAALIAVGRGFVIYSADDEGLIIGVLDETGTTSCVPGQMHAPGATIGYDLLALACGIVREELDR